MIVYHGTTEVIENPDVNYSKKYLDFGKEQFYTAAEAWLEYRKDKKFIDKFQYGSSTASAEEVLKYLFLDFLSVMNFEVNYKFTPLYFSGSISKLSEEKLKEIDELAILMLDIDENFYKLKEIYDINPKYRMLLSPLVGASNFELLIKNKNYNV